MVGRASITRAVDVVTIVLGLTPNAGGTWALRGNGPPGPASGAAVSLGALLTFYRRRHYSIIRLGVRT